MNTMLLADLKRSDHRLWRQLTLAIEHRNRMVIGPVLVRMMGRWRVDLDGLRDFQQAETERWLRDNMTRPQLAEHKKTKPAVGAAS